MPCMNRDAFRRWDVNTLTNNLEEPKLDEASRCGGRNKNFPSSIVVALKHYLRHRRIKRQVQTQANKDRLVTQRNCKSMKSED